MDIVALEPDSPDVVIPDDTSPEDRLRILNATAKRAAKHFVFVKFAKLIQQEVKNNFKESLFHPTLLWRVQAQFALNLVHRLRYIPDKEYREIFKGPLRSIREGDDCDGLSVVLSATLWALNIVNTIVWIPFPEAQYNHVSVLITMYGREWWAESTIKSASIGDSPWDLIDRGETIGGVAPAGCIGSAGCILTRPAGALESLPRTEGITPNWVRWNDPTTNEQIFVDFGLAQQWLDWVIKFTSIEQMQELTDLKRTQPNFFEVQRTHTIEAWNALGMVYNAANFTPLLDPLLLGLWQAHYGGPGAKWDPNNNYTVWHAPWRTSAFGSRVIALWQSIGKNTNNIPNRGNAGLIQRERLVVVGGSGGVQSRGDCNGNPYLPGTDGFCDFRQGLGLYRGWMEDKERTEGQGVPAYDWGVLSWDDSPQGLSPQQITWKFLLPLRWSFELCHRIATEIKRIGFHNWRAQASIYQVFYNVFGARRVGLLEGNDFAAMRERIAQVPQNDIDAGQWARANMRNAAQQMGGMARSLMNSPGPQALIGGAVAGVQSLLGGILPAAYGQMPTHDPDGTPIFYDQGGIPFRFITGNATLWSGKPSVTLPNAPGAPTPVITSDPTTPNIVDNNNNQPLTDNNNGIPKQQGLTPTVVTPVSTEKTTLQSVGEVGAGAFVLWGLAKLFGLL